MAFDAVILSGGRASRLGGTAKGGIVVEGISLLTRTLDAATGAVVRVVVGDAGPVPPAGVLVARETPAFGGPAAAIGAGLSALDRARREGLAESVPDLVLVLACDMPGIAASVPALLEAARLDPTADGALALDPDGRRQYLAAVYRRAPLIDALLQRSLDGMSMRSLVGGLRLVELPVGADATADIDSWEDAGRWGVSPEPLTSTTNLEQTR